MGPGFFIGDGAMLLLAAIAGVWAKRPGGVRTLALICGAVAVFATVSYGVDVVQQSGAVAPPRSRWMRSRTTSRTARSSSFSSIPHARTAPRRRGGWPSCRWGDTRVVATPVELPQFASQFLSETGLRAIVTSDFAKLKTALGYTAYPFGAVLVDGRERAAITKFDGDEPESTLRRLGLAELTPPFVIRFRRKPEGEHMRTFVILIAFSLAAFGQRHKAPDEVDAEKPEGKLLQQVMQESDPAKKIALLEQFAGEYPEGGADPVGAGAGAGLLREGQSAGPDHRGRRQAAGGRSGRSGGRAAGAQGRGDEEGPRAGQEVLRCRHSATRARWPRRRSPRRRTQVDAWKQEVEYAKQVAQYADYALFRAAMESRDPEGDDRTGRGAAGSAVPDSEYTGKVARSRCSWPTGRPARTTRRSRWRRRSLATDQTNEDMLLVVADNYLQQKKEPEKVHAYSAKIVEIMATKPKPEGTSDADWAARKNLVTGLAHYMSGKLYSDENKHAQADQELRKALPLVESNPALKPETLFLLGLVEL